MATIVRGAKDPAVEEILAALNQYEVQYQNSNAAIYRQNPGAIRIRITDNRFEGMPRSHRHEEVWKFLSDRVAQDTLSEVSTLILIPVSEFRSSLANLEFEDPVASGL